MECVVLRYAFRILRFAMGTRAVLEMRPSATAAAPFQSGSSGHMLSRQPNVSLDNRGCAATLDRIDEDRRTGNLEDELPDRRPLESDAPCPLVSRIIARIRPRFFTTAGEFGGPA